MTYTPGAMVVVVRSCVDTVSVTGAVARGAGAASGRVGAAGGAVAATSPAGWTAQAARMKAPASADVARAPRKRRGWGMIVMGPRPPPRSSLPRGAASTRDVHDLEWDVRNRRGVTPI